MREMFSFFYRVPLGPYLGKWVGCKREGEKKARKLRFLGGVSFLFLLLGSAAAEIPLRICAE